MLWRKWPMEPTKLIIVSNFGELLKSIPSRNTHFCSIFFWLKYILKNCYSFMTKKKKTFLESPSTSKALDMSRTSKQLQTFLTCQTGNWIIRIIFKLHSFSQSVCWGILRSLLYQLSRWIVEVVGKKKIILLRKYFICNPYSGKETAYTSWTNKHVEWKYLLAFANKCPKYIDTDKLSDNKDVVFQYSFQYLKNVWIGNLKTINIEFYVAYLRWILFSYCTL
jgi:hypothetical protein